MSVCIDVCCGITKNIAINGKHIVGVRYNEYVQITCWL